jgi:hypothetical protein
VVNVVGHGEWCLQVAPLFCLGVQICPNGPCALAEYINPDFPYSFPLGIFCFMLFLLLYYYIQ